MSMTSGVARHAVRTAIIATAIVAGLMLVLCVAVDAVVAHTLRSSAETRLSVELHQLVVESGGRALDEPDLDDPLLIWQFDDAGNVVRSTPGAPVLPPRGETAGPPTEMSIAGSVVLVSGASFQGGRLVGAISLAAESNSFTTLLVTEAVVAPILLALVFGGAFVVGRHAAGPVERARRRQLEFTADASHELRTPLAVIEAETSLALSTLRPGEPGAETIGRVAAETQRMRTIVEDLLWLSRFDSMPPDPIAEPVDLTTAIDVGAGRFAAIADRQGIRLDNLADPASPALVDAPADYLDRLIGVLLDNACRYTPRGGRVSVGLSHEGQRIRLLVTDTGPGFPKERRERIFDRFHRATNEGDGAGLGLAIANAIVGATRGSWDINDVPEGGTSVGVVWPRSRAHFAGRDK
jgi:signal transduction histidine kinase